MCWCYGLSLCVCDDNWNLASHTHKDPESLDALQGTRQAFTLKKNSTLGHDIAGAFSKGNKFKLSKYKNEPNFVSHVVSPDSDTVPEKSSLWVSSCT